MPTRALGRTGTTSVPEALPDFAAFLREHIEQGDLPDVKISPGAAFRRLFDLWVERGGYERGKPRHAVRRIRAWLGNEEVRSLETKLAGSTRLKRRDAVLLIDLFLSRWTYEPDTESYIPYCGEALGDLVRNLANDLFSDENYLLLPLRSRASANQRIIDSSIIPAAINQLDLSDDVIRQLWAESDALMTISRTRTIIGTEPTQLMTGFRKLIDDLYEIDSLDHKRRALIWIVDMGLRQDDASGRLAVYNLHLLTTLFRALALIDDNHKLKRWAWLRERVCVLVGSLMQSEIDQIYHSAGLRISDPKFDLRWFQAHRLFIESIPERWLDAPRIGAFGHPMSELWRLPTITAHLNLEGWDLHHDPEIDPQKNLKYLFHSSTNFHSEVYDERGAYCISLPEPGLRWSNGFRLAFSAAFGRLGWEPDGALRSVEAMEALVQLRRQNFAVLTLDEFRHLPDTLIDEVHEFSSDNSRSI